MNLYDVAIKDMLSFFDKDEPKVYPYQASRCWKLDDYNELVLKREAAFELGGSTLSSVNCTYVTMDSELVKQDEVVVYGPDLNEIKKDVSFVRMAILLIDNPGQSDEEIYTSIKQLDFIRYNVHPVGYMTRVSSENNREEIRVSQEALKQGINFEQIGNAYIKKYKENPLVKNVKIIFATDYSDIQPLIDNTKQVQAITKTLTVILDSLIVDCSKCQMKAVCDTVDGLREMHMNKNRQKGKSDDTSSPSS